MHPNKNSTNQSIIYIHILYGHQRNVWASAQQNNIGGTATNTTTIDIPAKEKLYIDTLDRITAKRQTTQPVSKKRKTFTKQSFKKIVHVHPVH